MKTILYITLRFRWEKNSILDNGLVRWNYGQLKKISVLDNWSKWSPHPKIFNLEKY